MRRLVSGHDAAGRNDRFNADANSRANKGLGADPGTVVDHDRMIAVRHVRLAVVVVARAQENPLGNTAMGANGDGLKIQDENLLTDPSMIPNGQFPGEIDIHARWHRTTGEWRI